MRPILLLFLLVFVPSMSAEKTEWTSWLPAKNATYRDTYGIEHDKTDFSYRWRLSTPCSGKDCSIDLQLRNNSDRREYTNFTIYIERENGSTTSDRAHRNFDPHEVQDVTVDSYGQRISQVKIE